ncbi:hypothetical protein J2S05_000824 [Alkalicoccobacillus murimartini]|uniref:Uncharacterized protein n=1 Tax=Alkalicoccobacillus murimartini TaxID=171685 RepID=A0ABT9YDW8_9BACI|nr:hypothetical protein [Alkalicoccobacillus murimartini]
MIQFIMLVFEYTLLFKVRYRQVFMIIYPSNIPIYNQFMVNN